MSILLLDTILVELEQVGHPYEIEGTGILIPTETELITVLDTWNLISRFLVGKSKSRVESSTDAWQGSLVDVSLMQPARYQEKQLTCKVINQRLHNLMSVSNFKPII